MAMHLMPLLDQAQQACTDWSAVMRFIDDGNLSGLRNYLMDVSLKARFGQNVQIRMKEARHEHQDQAATREGA